MLAQLLSPQAQGRKARALAIAARILALSPRPDVVCLQEAWCHAARPLLMSCLSSGYPCVFAPEQKCGLIIFSSRPMSQPTFTVYDGAKGIEKCVFAKGAAAIVLDVGGGKSIVVLNTHTQSDFWGSGARARAMQMLELGAFCDRIMRSATARGTQLLASCPAIMAGDLNVAAGTEEAATALNLLGSPVDALMDGRSVEAADASSFLTFPLGVWSRGQRKYILRTPTKRLDYILMTRPSAAIASTAVASIAHSMAYSGAQPLSDHAPLLLSLRL